MTHALRVSRWQTLILLTIGLIAGVALSYALGGTTANAQEGAAKTGVESMRTSTLEAKLAASTRVWIRGAGFVPGTSLTLLIADSYGVQTDISITGDPRADGGGSVYPLIVNDDGSWATEWLIGRFSRSGVGSEGMFTLGVYDEDYNLLATTPLALCADSRAEGAEVPPYCSE